MANGCMCQHRQRHGVGDQHRSPPAHRRQPEHLLYGHFLGSSPSALALGSDGPRYVANRGSNTVSVINTATNKVIDTNPSVSGTQSISVGSSPSALALGPDGRLYVANSGNGTVSVINTSGYAVATTMP